MLLTDFWVADSSVEADWLISDSWSLVCQHSSFRFTDWLFYLFYILVCVTVFLGFTHSLFWVLPAGLVLLTVFEGWVIFWLSLTDWFQIYGAQGGQMFSSDFTDWFVWLVLRFHSHFLKFYWLIWHDWLFFGIGGKLVKADWLIFRYLRLSLSTVVQIYWVTVF